MPSCCYDPYSSCGRYAAPAYPRYVSPYAYPAYPYHPRSYYYDDMDYYYRYRGAYPHYPYYSRYYDPIPRPALEPVRCTPSFCTGGPRDDPCENDICRYFPVTADPVRPATSYVTASPAKKRSMSVGRTSRDYIPGSPSRVRW